MTTMTTHLRRALAPLDPLELNYEEVALTNKQARLEGCTALRPNIDLSAYRCRAVIDWVELNFTLSRSTQFQWIQDALEKVLGRKPFVVALGPAPGEVAHDFKVTVQEATIPLVKAVVSCIEQQFGLASEPQVAGIEVSVDFYPKQPQEDARLRLAGVLARHFLPPEDFLTNSYDRPRSTWAKGKGGTDHLFRASENLSRQWTIFSSTEFDRSVPVDGTFYVGKKKADLMWRIMDKTIDRQNPHTGTLLPLGEKQRRTRMEVTLKGDEPVRAGLKTVSDLYSYRFSNLQGRYFQFVLPTFKMWTGTGTPDAVGRYFDQHRRRRFLELGVMGIVAMEKALAWQGGQHRPQLRKHFRQSGRKVRRSIRRGKGSRGRFVAYDDLCKRVWSALRRISGR